MHAMGWKDVQHVQTAQNKHCSLQEHPSVLSIDSFKQAVADARRLMPSANIENMLETDPDFVLSLQKGSDMIPYDAVPTSPSG